MFTSYELYTILSEILKKLWVFYEHENDDYISGQGGIQHLRKHM